MCRGLDAGRPDKGRTTALKPKAGLNGHPSGPSRIELQISIFPQPVQPAPSPSFNDCHPERSVNEHQQASASRGTCSLSVWCGHSCPQPPAADNLPQLTPTLRVKTYCRLIQRQDSRAGQPEPLQPRAVVVALPRAFPHMCRFLRQPH
jgi:hypothetical protein